MPLMMLVIFGVISSGELRLAKDYRSEVTDVVCQTEYFRPLCNSTSGQVVLINAAVYGRMRMNRCVRFSFGYLGCHTDVISVTDAECSGRRACAMQVIDDVFLRAAERGCPADLKPNLEVQYSCVSVIMPDHQRCYQSVTVTASSGYFASVVTQETGCGSSSAPWVVRAQPGQRINVTLYDFGATAAAKQNVSFGQATTVVYALLHETPTDRTVTISAGVRRLRNVFLSHGHVLQFRIVSNPASRFLLRYQVLGCRELEAPNDGWIHLARDRKSVDFGCDGSTDRWRMLCVGNTWLGHQSNCSKVGAISNGGHSSHALTQLTLGSSIAVMVVLACVTGSLVCIGGIVHVGSSST